MNLKVSVITVSFNSSDTIEATMQSVFAQNYKNIEYIVIDACSTDGTLLLLEKYRNKIDQLIIEKDNGLYDALNKGVRVANGNLIAFLHADDLYTHGEVISNYVRQFESSGADAVYADLNYVKREDVSVITRKWKSGKYNSNSFLMGWMPPHPTLVIKKSIYETYGFFNTSIGTAADYEFMLRVIHKNKIKIAYLPEVVIKMRTGGLSNRSLSNRVKANSTDRKAWQINNIKPRWYTLWLKPLRKIFQFFP